MVVVVPDAIGDPRAMVVHLQHTSTHSYMVRKADSALTTREKSALATNVTVVGTLRFDALA